MKRDVPNYRGYRFHPEIISHAVWLYHRAPQQAVSMANENCTLRGDTSRAERTFFR